MFDKVAFSGWLLLIVLIVCPCTTMAQSSTPTTGEIWKEPTTGMEFVWVPGGCYEMGCGSWTSNCVSDEKPVHEVCVDGFWMGKTEVTQGQWKQVMGENPAEFNKGDSYPVEKVSWPEVEKFFKNLSSMTTSHYEFRLPTEAEWEYACRSGGNPEKYAGGDDLDRLAWHQRNSNRSTHSVATKEPNGLGLFDMSGNVNEWCSDNYRVWAYKKHKRNNPLFIADRVYSRIYRGGSWNSNPKSVRCSARNYELGIPYQNQIYRSYDLGFRLVRNK